MPSWQPLLLLRKKTVERNDFERASTVNLSGELTVKWIQTNKSVDYINNLTVCK